MKWVQNSELKNYCDAVSECTKFVIAIRKCDIIVTFHLWLGPTWIGCDVAK